MIIKCENTLSLRIDLSKLKDSQIVSLPPIYLVIFSVERCFSAPSKVKEETMVRRKLFLSFPQAGSNVDFCVGSVSLCDGHQMGLQPARVRWQELGRGSIGTSKKQRSFLP